MPLETGTYINNLVSSNPPQSDSLSQAAGHLRLIKALLLATFPNVTGAVTGTQAQLNTAASLATSGQYVPAGVMFEYAGASLPTGYLWCDGSSLLRTDYAGLFTAIGTTYGAADATHFNVPDCRDKFSLCKGTTYPTLGATGGAATATLAQANLPNCTFNLSGISASHSLAVGTSITNGTSVLHGSYVGNNNGTGSSIQTLSGPSSSTLSLASGTVSGTITVSGGTAASGGTGTAFSILNPYLVVNKIIKT